MLRSTNTGITTLILPDGEITHPTGINTQEIMNVRVPITEPIPTLIKSWGDWFGPVALVCGIIGLWLLEMAFFLSLYQKNEIRPHVSDLNDC
jgi:apolipoprotein N-acyltransferase